MVIGSNIIISLTIIIALSFFALIFACKKKCGREEWDSLNAETKIRIIVTSILGGLFIVALFVLFSLALS